MCCNELFGNKKELVAKKNYYPIAIIEVEF